MDTSSGSKLDASDTKTAKTAGLQISIPPLEPYNVPDVHEVHQVNLMDPAVFAQQAGLIHTIPNIPTLPGFQWNQLSMNSLLSFFPSNFSFPWNFIPRPGKDAGLMIPKVPSYSTMPMSIHPFLNMIPLFPYNSAPMPRPATALFPAQRELFSSLSSQTSSSNTEEDWAPGNRTSSEFDMSNTGAESESPPPPKRKYRARTHPTAKGLPIEIRVALQKYDHDPDRFLGDEAEVDKVCAMFTPRLTRKRACEYVRRRKLNLKSGRIQPNRWPDTTIGL